ncbi:MAG: response regulator transcription factor, partial [Pseudomonadota bacterium]|nr:response regulator transcription factor [Pseudomonadota bacterium]
GEENGLEICRQLRSEQDVAIILVSALSADSHRISGYAVGADDYIAKPFEPRELILRIQRILDRQAQQTATGLVKFGAFTFDCDSHILTETGQRVHITTAEQDLLSCFAATPNQVLSRDDISAQLNGRMKGRSIDVAVARLRTKLEADPRFPVYLQTSRGKGWLLRTN